MKKKSNVLGYVHSPTSAHKCFIFAPFTRRQYHLNGRKASLEGLKSYTHACVYINKHTYLMQKRIYYLILILIWQLMNSTMAKSCSHHCVSVANHG